MLHNSILSGKKFASNDKFNAFVSENVDAYKNTIVY